MSIILSANEIINIAISLERRGIMFYDIMAKSADNAMAKDVFQSLADMERTHVQIFQEMLGKVDKYQPSETPAKEHADYIQALVDNAVFTDDMITSEMATHAETDIKAMELGISAEKDSIIFYYDMRDVMPRRVSHAINRIIAEEKSHLQQLSEMKKKLLES